MRHRKRRSRLSMKTAARKATLRNMVRSLIEYQKIETILRRARECRRIAEHVITIAKTDTVAARRRAYMVLGDRDLVGKLFKDIAPLFKNRAGGYTRIIPLGFRRGDGAQMAILELTEKKIEQILPKKKKEKAAKQDSHAEGAHAHKKDAAGHDVKHHEEVHETKDDSKIKSIPKSKPTLVEEKRAQTAKAEDAKLDSKKSFTKNLRGFFKRKSDM